ncbi:MAG TPA: FAD-binding oxidoreductase [Solirubrobacteraceae bacterium]|nr:FAD-binding oxidoreductase [Solirubrobacteraceae bacterium]
MPAREMRWWGWGEDGQGGPAPAHAVAWLEAQLGAPLGPETPPVALEDVRLPRTRLRRRAAEALRAIVGEDGVREDRAARVVHAAGKGYPDLVRLRAGEARPAPDAVVLPASAGQVGALLGACALAGVAVVPFGGGTSVVGGVEPLRGPHHAVIALDLARLTRMRRLDERSRLASFEPGLRGPEVEHLLRARGLTLGHFPQSFEYSTVGGWVATRSAGQASTGYGRIDELVAGLTLTAPAGEVALAPHPASAAGPDLRELIVGSEGALGVLTEMTLEVQPRPAAGSYEGWMLPSFEAGTEALREMAQSGATADVVRLSDERETGMSLALSGLTGARAALTGSYLRARHVAGGALAIVGWEGDADAVLRRRRATRAVLARHGGAALGPSAGRAWARGRFHAPYLRDELLGRGVLVETLETAGTWSGLERLYRAVRAALEAHAPFVACHVSHVYPSGASLYFTFLAPMERERPLAQWTAIKRAACEAIVDAGGTITHHHGIGRDHAAYLAAEDGEQGVAALRALKAQLDPAGIMNPGKLVTSSGRPSR